MAPPSSPESPKSSSGVGKRKARFAGRSTLLGVHSGPKGKVTDRRLAEERALWISERQAELTNVLDRHDDLVREIFHLEKFVTMVSFDPKAAKEDKSAVFQDYKARYDLLEKMTDTAGPTRKTRSAHTERLQHLNVTSSPIDSSPSKPSNDAIWDIISSAKAKSAKARGGVADAGDTDDSDSATSISLTRDKIPSKIKGKIAASTRVDVSSFRRLGDSLSRTKRVVEKDVPDDSSPPPRKKRKTGQVPPPGSVKKPRIFSTSFPPKSNGHLPIEIEHFSKPTALVRSQRLSSRISATRGSKSQAHVEPNSQNVSLAVGHGEQSSTNTVKSVASPSIRRIKLIVRQPPPLISHPRQRPPRPAHGASLTAFLSSYHTVDDRDLGEDAMNQMAKTDAAVMDRIDSFRVQGRLLPEDASLAMIGAGTKPTFVEPKRGPDPWDQVVHTILAQSRGRRTKGRQIASQIASKIQAYWDGYASRKDKARIQEEKRLKMLAKSTIKTVINEWKKAVFHIREEERSRLEAEEMRLGHEHLDAILDQSGHILETQQVDLIRGDLSRSRSRSSSASLLPRDGTSEDSDECSSPDTEDDDNAKSEIGEELVDSGQDDDSDADIRGLLNGVSAELEGPTDSTCNKTPEDIESDNDNDSTVAVDELMAINSPESRSSSHDPPDPIYDREGDYASSPTTSLPLPESPPDDAGIDIDAPADLCVVQGLEPTLVNSDLLPDVILQEISASNDNGVVNDVGHTLSKDEGHLAPASSDIPESIELAEDQTPAFQLAASEVDAGDKPEATDKVVDSLVPPAPSPANNEVASTSADYAANDAVLEDVDEQLPEDQSIPEYLKPYAVAPVEWDSESKVRPPLLLRGILRPYQQSGLEWLASLHMNNLNGILADEMGLGKTIQAISLLAHLACDRGIWGPHLIVVPTSVLLNWEMEFKKFLPGFKILSYHGSTKRRKELRQGWNDKQHFNVCITSYTLASRDAHIFKRKAWYYMILDEAHMIKNFKSQRWNILLMFRSFRRLLLTGTPLQNNLTELWALLQFLMSGANFANLKEFGDWFSNPLEKAIEMGTVLDDETQQRVSKLHTVLRPYLLRRLKRDVEKELPSKYEHLVLCPLSKRQRFLYDEFMSRAQTRDALQSGVYQKVANILMQLRKVCNHPDLFEVRPIVTSFATERSAIANFEIKELLIRRRLLESQEDTVNLDMLGLQFIGQQNKPMITALESRRLDATPHLPLISEMPGEPPPKDTRTIAGFQRYTAYRRVTENTARWSHIGYLNELRCNSQPIYGEEMITSVKQLYRPLFPASVPYPRTQYLTRVDTVGSLVKSYTDRASDMSSVVDKFAFVTPSVVARDLARIALDGHEASVQETATQDIEFDAVLHKASVKLQIAFPDPSLLQYDCGKLQELTRLLREKKAGGHRILIFTQMTKILDILEIFLNFHGYLYLRLDGATKIEDRQYITERFNADPRVFCFIASSRSGGVGINLTGADTVVFYDSDFNPQMDRQCEDRAHRIGQIRDVHIYRFISQHTVEEAMLRKANQKRSLDDLVIQKGEFDWRTLFVDEAALTKALGEFEDTEDAHAAAVAAREEYALEGADEEEFGGDADFDGSMVAESQQTPNAPNAEDREDAMEREDEREGPGGEDVEEGGTVVDYMLSFVGRDYDFFRDWRI